jgi:hypothetical protein
LQVVLREVVGHFLAKGGGEDAAGAVDTISLGRNQSGKRELWVLERGPYARAAGVHEEPEVGREMLDGAHDAAHHAHVDFDFLDGV